MTAPKRSLSYPFVDWDKDPYDVYPNACRCRDCLDDEMPCISVGDCGDDPEIMCEGCKKDFISYDDLEKEAIAQIRMK